MFLKRDLIRIIYDAQNNNFCLDIKQNIQARGAYICNSKECLARSKKIHGFERSFKIKIKSIDNLYEILKSKLNLD